MDPREEQAIIEEPGLVTPFAERVAAAGAAPLRASGVEIVQVNVGRRCNLACRHCHLAAGPERPELMERAVMASCLHAARRLGAGTIDVTGGAPELSPHLDWFLGEAAAAVPRVLVRTNAAILCDPDYARYADCYARRGVTLVVSLPDPRRDRTDRQRGAGAFDAVIAGLRRLNALGFGVPGLGRELYLVHNPAGAYLPGPQASLEAHYRAVLGAEQAIVFTGLFVITNVPVGRYLEYLMASGNLGAYLGDLAAAFNPAALAGVMCRTTLSVGHDGRCYDCDFNQTLELPVRGGLMIGDAGIDALRDRMIVTGNHCYACTAGSGSSCQGATVA